MNDKQRIYAKLLNVHDLLYNVIETIEDMPASETLSKLLNDLDTANAQMESVMEAAWWKKDSQ